MQKITIICITIGICLTLILIEGSDIYNRTHPKTIEQIKTDCYQTQIDWGNPIDKCLLIK